MSDSKNIPSLKNQTITNIDIEPPIKKQVHSFEQLSKLKIDSDIEKQPVTQKAPRSIDVAYNQDFKPESIYNTLSLEEFNPYAIFLSQQQYHNEKIRTVIAHLLETVKNGLNFKQNSLVIINPYKVLNQSVLKERDRILATKKQQFKDLKKTTGKKGTEPAIADVRYHVMLKSYDKLNKSERMKHVVAQEGLYFLRKYGTQRVSYPDISNTISVPVGGLISYYTSQESMVYEIATYHQEEFLFYVLDAGLTAENGLPRLFSIISHWIGWILRGELGDLLTSMLFELDDVSDDDNLKSLLSATMRTMTEHIKDALCMAIEKKEVTIDSEDADFFMHELQGILLATHHQSYFLKNKSQAFKFAFKSVNKLLQIK